MGKQQVSTIRRLRLAFGALIGLLFAGPTLAGQVSHHHFFSDALGRHYPYSVYLPDGYAVTQQAYPVLYLLHGSNRHGTDWIHQGRIQETVEWLMSQGRIPPTVIIMPSSRSWWVDGHNEPARTAFLDDLLPHIETHWHVRDDRQGRAIAGISAGGYGTLNFILERPELFSAAAVLSPASYAPLPPANSSARRHAAFLTPEGEFDAALWDRLNYTSHLDSYMTKQQRVPLYLSAGNRDRYDAVRHAQQIYDALQWYQADDMTLEIFRGGHTWRVWNASLPSALEFIFRHTQGPSQLTISE
ncbi:MULTISPECIES: esterase family protein [Halomonadaceae]|uniref:alpha/beta hydrolase n=1 Tax=Halomonadaceae TaxID=28256 RepID=UPI00159908BA|nr:MULTISPECIES: alpha/beta hydrolase-fold protein [Halomonas]QJQ96303.1 prolyl oligopeptidase family serine peptidase [Halomonas sp. PA5]